MNSRGDVYTMSEVQSSAFVDKTFRDPLERRRVLFEQEQISRRANMWRLLQRLNFGLIHAESIVAIFHAEKGNAVARQ